MRCGRAGADTRGTDADARGAEAGCPKAPASRATMRNGIDCRTRVPKTWPGSAREIPLVLDYGFWVHGNRKEAFGVCRELAEGALALPLYAASDAGLHEAVINSSPRSKPDARGRADRVEESQAAI